MRGWSVQGCPHGGFWGSGVRRHNATVGVLTHYFSASSDEVAATAVNRLGGPGTPTDGPSALPPFDTAEFKDIDPIVNLGTLESILTGVDYDVITADTSHGRLVAQRDDEGPWVISVSAELQAALATVDSDQLTRADIPWTKTEEFRRAAPQSMLWVIEELAGLARRATAKSERLYCWICL